MTARTEAGRTRLEIVTGTGTGTGTPYTLTVDRDSTVSADVAPSEAMVVGNVGSTAVVVADAYPSIPGGMSFCQAGTERFLRVISLAAPAPTETYKVKLASCRGNIELVDGGIAWQRDSSTVRLHWLMGPDGVEETRALRVGDDGRITPAKR